MNSFAIVLEQIIIFAVYMLIGVIAVKTNVLNRSKLDVLSICITKILLPLLIFTNTINGTTRSEFMSALIILFIAVGLYLILYLVSIVLTKIMKIKGNKKKIYQACVTFGNCGFMGIPLITALFPQQGGLYISMYTIIDQLMLWTLGVELTTPVGKKADVSFSQQLKKMINPATVAVLLGVFFVLTGIHLPLPIVTALSKTGAAASPLALIFLGGIFCYIHMGEYLKRVEIYVMIIVKMIVMPLVVYMALSHISFVDPSIQVTISILCGLPSMTTISMMAENQHSDGDYASGIIFMTTLFSILTLPMICTFIG